MRLVSFLIGTETRLGALLPDKVVDLNLAYGALLSKQGKTHPAGEALGTMPPDMIGFLELGPDALQRARDLVGRIEAGETFVDVQSRRYIHGLASVRLLAPVPRPRKVIVVGLNYGEHVAESQVDIPDWPWTFGKLSTVLIGPDHPIGHTPLVAGLDGEVELAIIIGRRGKYIPREHALDYVAGYSIFNDVSARNIQFDGEAGLRFFYLGKNFQGSAALGPYLATPDEISDPHNLDMEMLYDDRLVRKGNTRHYIFRVEELIAFYSRFFTLEPGDVISGGCPPAIVKMDHHVFFEKDYRFLKPGNTCICRLEHLGSLENPVIDAGMPLSANSNDSSSPEGGTS
jgi:acylpyruvate hydrolase